MSDRPIDPMPFAAGLFGTHVGRRSGESGPLAELVFAQGQAEIGHERLARPGRAADCRA